MNLLNTAGWSCLHAAAAAGHTKVISCLLRAGADLSLRDRGGSTPLVEACGGGHAAAVQLLVRAGAPLETVRLSQTKGPAVRTMVIEAYRASGGGDGGGDGSGEAPEPVGYARVQQRSNAFYGPRRTPISCKLKKRLLKEKRERKRADCDAGVTGVPSSDSDHEPEPVPEPEPELDGEDAATTAAILLPVRARYAETVHDVKKASKLSRGSRRGRARRSATEGPDAADQESALSALPGSVCCCKSDPAAPPMSRTTMKKARRLQRKAAAAAAASADDGTQTLTEMPRQPKRTGDNCWYTIIQIVLVNVVCQAQHPQTPASDLQLPSAGVLPHAAALALFRSRVPSLLVFRAF